MHCASTAASKGGSPVFAIADFHAFDASATDGWDQHGAVTVCVHELGCERHFVVSFDGRVATLVGWGELEELDREPRALEMSTLRAVERFVELDRETDKWLESCRDRVRCLNSARAPERHLRLVRTVRS